MSGGPSCSDLLSARASDWGNRETLSDQRSPHLSRCMSAGNQPVDRDIMGAAFPFVASETYHLDVGGIVATAIGERDDVVDAELGPSRRMRRNAVAGTHRAVLLEVSVDCQLSERSVLRAVAPSSGAPASPFARATMLRTPASIAELAALQACLEGPIHRETRSKPARFGPIFRIQPHSFSVEPSPVHLPSALHRCPSPG